MFSKIWLRLAHALVVAAWVAPACAHPTASVQVLHWWNAPSEMAGVQQLQQLAAQQGLRWANVYTRADAMQRYPALLHDAMRPTSSIGAALIPTYLLHDLQQRGVLLPLTTMAQQHRWNDVLPRAVAAQLQHEGQWWAAPLSVHSINWMWVNLEVAQQLGITHPPDTWKDFVPMLQRAQRAGIVPIAVGPNAWEQALLFELIASGYLGAERFRWLFFAGQHAQFRVADLEPVFERWQQLQPFLTANAPQSQWLHATDQVASGKALLQVAGNWVEGHLRQAQQSAATAGVRFDCWRFPDTQAVVHFNTDALVFFAGKNVQQQQAQLQLAQFLMQPQTQVAVNHANGAPPARVDIDRHTLSRCAQRSISDMRMANTRDTLLPNFFMGTAKHMGLQQVLPRLLQDSLQGALSPREAASALLQMLRSAPSQP